MKIVYCVFDCSNFGGTERTLALQANYFAERGHQVNIVTTEVPKFTEPYYHFSEKIRIFNLDVRYAEVDGSMSPVKIWRRIQKGRLHKQRLRTLVADLRPDILVSLFSHEMAFLNDVKGDSITIAQLHFSKQYRLIENRLLHKPLLSRWFTLLKEWRKKLHIHQYDAFVVLTHEDAANWNLDNIHVIPNALPFVPDSTSKRTAKRAISVGRLNVQKGYDQLLMAWRKVAEVHPDWELDIYGSGEERDHLMQMVRDNSLEPYCHIHDAVSNIQEKYLESSFYVLSSLYEGFGIVLIEAMACGLPCVSYACPCGPSDIITDGEDGLLVPSGDVDRLADSICRIISDREMRETMGQKAVSSVKRYSQEVVMNAWNDLFLKLLSGKK